MGSLNQISPDPIVLLCNAVMPPPLPGDDVILPHTIATVTVSGGNQFGSSSSSVVCHSHYSSCLHNHQCLTASPHLSIQCLKYCSFFSLRSHSPSNQISCYRYAHYLFVFMLERLNHRLANSLKLCMLYCRHFFHNCVLAFYCFGGLFILDCDSPFFFVEIKDRIVLKN